MFVQQLKRLFESWVDQNFANPKRRHRGWRSKGSYQALEARRLLAVYTVDTLADSLDFTPDGQISLREAIEAANTNAAVGDAPAGDPAGDSIFFAAELVGQTIQITEGELLITEALEIRAGGGVELNAGDGSRLLHVDTDQRVVISDLTLTDGRAEQGSGLFVEGGASVVLNRVFLSSNGQSDDGGATYSGQGGGIYSLESDVTILNSELRNNVASRGGAIFSRLGQLTVIGSTISSNYTSGVGGGIAVEGGQSYISNSKISNNWATDPILYSGGAGGGLHISGPYARVLVDHSQFSENVSGFGGGVFNGGNNQLTVRGDSLFESNRAFGIASPNGTTPPNGNGGGIANHGHLYLSSSQFYDNSSGFGAAIYSQEAIGLLDQIEVQANRASRSGGGIAVRGGQVTILNSTIGGPMAEDGNRAVSTGTLHGDFGTGGGLSLLDSTQPFPSTQVRLVNSTVSNNRSFFSGGGVHVESRGFLYAYNNTQVSHNLLLPAVEKFSPTRGGGIFSEGVLWMQNITVSGNHSPEYGGGLAVAGGWARIGNSTITANRADHAGGGLSLTGGMALLYRNTIGGTDLVDGNLAGTYGEDGALGIGGGAYVAGEGTRLRLIESRLASNTATFSGGGIFNDGGIVRTEIQNDFSGNRALREDGGGIFNQSGHLELSQAVFLGNTARNGGGIFNEGGSVHLTRSRIQLNEARRTGGGIFNRSYLRILDSVIENNVATFHPDLYDATRGD